MRIIIYLFFIILIIQGCKTEYPKKIESDNFEFIELGDGIYSCIHKFGGKAICNVGIVDNGNETIIFDSFLSPSVAEELLTAIQKFNLSPVKYVVNSHFHNDHIRGNQVFSSDVKIISTSKTKDLIEKEEPLQITYEKENAPARLAHYDSLYNSFDGDKNSREFQQILMWRPYYETLANSHSEVRTRVPDTIVDSIQHFDGPKRKIQLLTKGEGHSESDLVMHLPDDGVLFTGDLIFNKCHPYVAHGNIAKWHAWLEFFDSLNVSTVMPGHGEMGTNELIQQMKDYLKDLESAAEELIAKDLSIGESENLSIPDKYKNWWFDRFYAYNLQFAYETLNKKNAE